MSVRLYVGNLPEELTRQELEAIFAEEGDAVSTKIITDRKTNKCRGFGFVTVKNEEQADAIIEKFNGYALKDASLKVERAQPRSKDKGADEAPITASSAPSSNKGRKGNNNKSKNRSSSGSSDLDSVQPDPRWAQELEKLKQLLAAQASNS